MIRITRTASVIVVAVTVLAGSFGLLPGGAPTAEGAAEPSLSFGPDEGDTGTVITIEGRDCFLGDGTTGADGVIVTMENQDGDQVAATTVPVAADGTFAGELRVPAGAPPGTHTLAGTCVTPELPPLGTYVGGPFTVTGEGEDQDTVAADQAPSAEPAGGGIEPYPAYDGQTTCSPTPKAGTVAFAQRTLAAFPGTGDYGIGRACGGGTSEHYEGRAWDWAANAGNAAQHGAVDQMLDWLLATDAQGNRHAMARRLGVMYIIWDRQMFRMYRVNDGWQPYGGSNPHTDHVHISFTRAGGAGATSFWSMTSPPPWGRATGPGGFWDVWNGAWFEPGLVWAIDRGVMTGYPDGSFRPHVTLDRSQALMAIWRAQGKPQVSTDHPFVDAADGAWYDAALDWAAANGVLTGYPDGTFRAHEQLTRAQYVMMMWRIAGQPAAAGSDTFTDTQPGMWFASGAAWAAQRGYMTGYPDGTFGPDLAMNRAQAVMVFWRSRQFDDVDVTAWYAPPVDWARYRGVMNGYADHTFHPGEAVNRAETVSILHKIMDSPAGAPPSGFVDVAADAWYHAALDWATAHQVITGYPDGTFRAADPVNRAQLITMMWRIAGSPSVTGRHAMTDVAPGAWYGAALDWAAENELLDGFGAQFGPDHHSNRAEVAALLSDLAGTATAWSATVTPPSTTTF
jgi:hypothetical protein